MYTYVYILIGMIQIFVDVTQKKLNWYFFHKEIYNCLSNKSSLEGLKDCLIMHRKNNSAERSFKKKVCWMYINNK